ncbi:NAD-dependent epimerase/dehydratase family protein [Halomarina salina]|uniref:NAD-dependent epimerase/dehydratase family protein n=1 Tax=Halomarina salina TaxID=1872699 RepID=A0ABD5RTN3_9EURY|nr:NAD(P)-dependent oxidoreductase [Halomarina salina]
MAYLITGGTGFLGARVAHRLVSRGEDVVLFDYAPVRDRITGIEDDVTLVRGDIRQVEQLARVFVEHDVTSIAHLASALTGTCSDQPPLAMSINAVGSANVLELASIHDVNRVVFASSLAAYGYVEYDEEREVDEKSPRWPNNLYGSTKVLKEDMGRHYAAENDMNVFGLRFGAIVGPGRAGGTPVVHLQDLFENPATGKPVTVTGAELKMNWLYVKDAAASIIQALDVSQQGFDMFNVRDRFMSVRAVAGLVAENVPDADITVVSEPDEDHYPYGTHPKLDDTKMREVLGFTPEVGLESGIQEYVRLTAEQS